MRKSKAFTLKDLQKIKARFDANEYAAYAKKIKHILFAHGIPVVKREGTKHIPMLPTISKLAALDKGKEK